MSSQMLSFLLLDIKMSIKKPIVTHYIEVSVLEHGVRYMHIEYNNVL